MHKIIMPRHRTLIRNAAASRIEQYHNTSFNQIKAKLEQRTHLFIYLFIYCSFGHVDWFKYRARHWLPFKLKSLKLYVAQFNPDCVGL